MKYSLAILALCLCFIGCSKKDEWPEFKTCERCKETDIKYWADVCKYCGKDPDGTNGPEKRAELMKIWLEEKRSSETTLAGSGSGAAGSPLEAAIREELKKPTGELTKADLAKVTFLDLGETALKKAGGKPQITDAGLKELAKLQELTRLNLNYTQITDAGLKEVAKCKQLTDLHLDHTKITDSGLKELAKLQQLTKLDLSGCEQITDAGLKEVAKMQKLRGLALNSTEITDTGLKEVAKLQKLEELVLAYTEVTDAGLKEVAKCKQLTDLHLDHTKITDSGLKELAKLQQLKTLWLYDTKVTKAGVAELKKALPKCRILGK